VRLFFGDCELDTLRRELRRSGAPVAIEPQVFDVLVHLIENREQVVSRDDLIAAVWRGRIVSESALANRMNAARAAIGDSGDVQRFIRTLPRRGFRFIETVYVYPLLPREHAQGALPLPDQPSLVVLPFRDLSAGRDWGHVADGMTEDVITNLARIRWMFVIARNTAFVYKERVGDVKQLAHELGVRYVLEGSVRRAEQRMRVNAQLIDATSGMHLWAERYDRDAGALFEVQDEITASVAAAVEPSLLAAEAIRARRRPAEELGAWELVARSQSHSFRLTKADYEVAIAGLEQALAQHPNYAPARALLGFCLAFAAHMGWLSRECLEAARMHAEHAIGLDDGNPWGYSALGYTAMMQRNTDDCLGSFRQAVQLNPNSAAAHSHLSRGLAFAGHDREAIKHGELAIRLSPRDPDMPRFLGGMAIAHYTARRFDESSRYTAENLRMQPGFQGAQRLRCASLAQAGRTQEASTLFEHLQRSHYPPLTVDWVKENVPYQTAELMALFIEGLRKAGLRD
jgi:TolB-like protein